MDALGLKTFYESDLGKITCQKLRTKISSLWPEAAKENILGFGFTLPYMPLFTYGNNCTNAMPPETGAMKIDENSQIIISSGQFLPFKNEFFDRVIIIHALETNTDTEKIFEEIWRVLKPAGKLLLVAPNNKSLWQKFKNPFNEGKSFSRVKLVEHIRYSRFTPKRFAKSLFFLPINYRPLIKLTDFIGKIFLHPFAGVYLIEAEKLMFSTSGRPIRISPGRFNRKFKPILAGQT